MREGEIKGIKDRKERRKGKRREREKKVDIIYRKETVRGSNVEKGRK